MLRVVCVSTAFMSIIRLSQWLYLSTGATDRQMRWALVTTPVFLAAALIGGTFGILGIGIGLACANLVMCVPSVMFAIRGTSLTLWTILSVWLAPLFASVVAALGLAAFGAHLPNAERLIGLAARGCVFVALYASAWMLMPGGRTMLSSLRLRAT
jgi:O-antigen/teichoic acid export membrane protein